jgi:regulator of protease activity HflC (stomatin/prohibitin superfamily)
MEPRSPHRWTCRPCALAALALASCVTVPPGRAALVTGLSGLEPPLGEGVHWVGPWASSELIDLRQQERDDDLRAITADGAVIEAGTSLVTWRPVPDELRELAREVGPDVYAVAVGPVVSSCARKVLGRLRLDELDTSHLRAAQAEVTALAAAALRPLHILLEGVELRQVVPLSPGVRRGFEAAAALEERVKGVPDQLRLAAVSEERDAEEGSEAADEALRRVRAARRPLRCSRRLARGLGLLCGRSLIGHREASRSWKSGTDSVPQGERPRRARRVLQAGRFALAPR